MCVSLAMSADFIINGNSATPPPSTLIKRIRYKESSTLIQVLNFTVCKLY